MNVPTWVSETCEVFNNMSLGKIDLSQCDRKPIAKRPRKLNPGATESPLRATQVRQTSPRARRTRNIQAHDNARMSNSEQVSDSDENDELEREKVSRQAGNEFEDKIFAKFLDCLKGFVSLGWYDKGSKNARTPTAAALKATANQKLLLEIRESISIHARNKMLHKVPDRLLSELMNALVARVRHALSLCKDVDMHDHKVDVVTECLLAAQCSSIILTIFSAPNVARTILVEEVLDDTAGFVCSVSANVIYPECDPLYRSTMAKISRKGKKERSGCGDMQSNPDVAENSDELIESKGTKRNGGKKVTNLISSCAALYQLLGKLVRRRQVSETVGSQVASVAIRSLRIIGVVGIHTSAVTFVATAYASYPALAMSIVNDLLDEIAYLPANRRHLRTYRVISSSSTSIRASSAMVLHIAQVAAARHVSVVLRKEDEQANTSNENSSLLIAAFEHANRFASLLVGRVLSRIFQERDPEYKIALQALLDDIMSLYSIPEWPGADILLRNFSAYIVGKLQAQGKEKLNALARALAIEYLGALTHRMSTLFGPDLLRKINEVDMFNDSAMRQQQLEERVLLLRFFQDNLSKGRDETGPRGLWEAILTMEDFNVGRKIRGQSSRSSNPRSADAIEEPVEDENSNASHFAKTLFFQRKEALSAGKHTVEAVSRQDASIAAKGILSKTGLSRGFNAILEAILFGLQDPTPTVRARAVRALSHMAFDKPTIMHYLRTIFTVMEDSCRDVSTLVRDAALDFLGGFLTFEIGRAALKHAHSAVESQDTKHGIRTGSHIFLKVFQIVEKRLKDSATSVRKRAINILRNLAVDILVKRNGQSSGQTEVISEISVQYQENLIVTICSSLVGRLDDPEATVRSIAERTVRFALFSVDVGEAFECVDEEEYANRSTQRLVALFRRLPYGSQSNLFTRIINKVMLRNNKKNIAAIVRSTVDSLHELEDRLANSAQSVPNGKTKQQSIYEVQRVACTSILYGFCVLEPSLIAPHCAALGPHLTSLKPVTDSDIACAKHILRLLERSIPYVTGLEPAFLEQTISDVEIIVCQIPTSHLEEPSVRCLCALALHAGTDACKELLINTANTFFNFLVEQLPSLQALGQGMKLASSNVLERNSRGALVRLSLLLRFGHYLDDFVQTVFRGLNDICTAMLENWTEDSVSPGSPILLRASVRAMMHFLTRHRSFLPKGTNTIMRFATVSLKRMEKYGDKDKDSMDILHQVFMGFHEMLRNEEERNSSPRGDESSIPVRTMSGNGDVENHVPHLAAEEDAEAGYLAVCAQSLLPSLSDAAKCVDVHVRRCVANILGLLTRQGLVLPATIVSPLFSLIIDHDGKCRDDALRVVAFIADRHSSMLAAAALPAIQDCFLYAIRRLERMQSIDSPLQRIVSSILDSKAGFTLFSSTLCMMSLDYRRSILEGLLREFDPCLTTVVREKESKRIAIETLLDGNDIEVAESEDDDMEDGVPIELYGRKKVGSISNLVLAAVTVARLDYSSGAGIGGVLQQSGGTAAVEVKLKKGRDLITEMCGIATRIISNSGQAVLRVAVQRLKVSGFSPAEKSLIADHANRLCLLLRLKTYLRKLKCTSGQSANEYGQDMDKDQTQTAPTFLVDDLMLTAGPLCADPLLPLSTDTEWTKQIAMFRKMMNDDCIEDNEIQVRQSSRTARKNRSAKRSTSKIPPSSGRVKKSRRVKKANVPRQLKFFEDSGNESEYHPNT